MIPQLVTCFISGYLLGNINGAILVSRWFHSEDIREKGSGNAGLTNFYRIYGGFETLLVLLIDVGKTVLACFVGKWIFENFMPDFTDSAAAVCGAMSVVGHIFPAMFKLHGGKGILCCAALAACLDWRIFAVCIAVFLLAVVCTRFVSLGSVLSAVVFPVATAVLFPRSTVVIVTVITLSVLVIVMHRHNLRRLFCGTEAKFEIKKRPKGDKK